MAAVTAARAATVMAGATVVRGPEGADPASVAFDAVKQATAEGADAVLLDTAGRLHTKTGLMDELGKVKRVVSRQAEVDEVLLVLDATTGSFVFEVNGGSDKIETFVALMAEVGLVEVARTGIVAIARGKDAA